MSVTHPSRRAVLVACALAATLFPVTSAFAETYPSKPVKVIVPYGPGSNPDVATRIVMHALQAKLGQPFVIDNKFGAGGGIGLSAAAKSAPDGYTIVVGHIGGLAINPNIYSSLPYDANRDFIPIAQMYNSPLVLLVAANSRYKTVADLLVDAKANPGKLTFSSGGNGNGAHLTGESLNKLAGVSMRHVPYKTMGPALTDVVGGEITFTFGNFSLGMPLVKGGKMRALALSGSARDPQYPDIPTVAETVKGFEYQDWTGVLAPKGTSAEIVTLLQREIAAVLANPDVIAQLRAQGLNAVQGGTSAQFAAFIDSEQKKWGAVAKSIDLKID
ncbi:MULTISPECIES: tripartite tricarboxylate transporter substrate binding protein [unclassified Variovorax]|uniref:Bug family tripartite tricarboxylate transporter substrate binding protein n=1 Tax=unclassified Variovorax TaxID=663243 RepID=UPI001BD5C728|nr:MULTISPECIES: tripartite tricarboxylate transporter substrate binding protein [unclassified Variovorax]